MSNKTASKTTLRISGKSFTLPERVASQYTLEARPGGWLIATEKATGRRIRLAAHEARGKLSVLSEGHLWFGEVRVASAGASQSGGGDADLVAQFPGKVRKLLVVAGAEVAEGDKLLLVEAMKMEFAVKAPFAGKVSKIHVSEGQQLSPGTRFLDLEPAVSTGGQTNGQEGGKSHG